MNEDIEWCTIDEALIVLGRYFNTKSALKYHLAHRKNNGLSKLDAVRITPMGHLIVNTDRVRSWCLGEDQSA